VDKFVGIDLQLGGVLSHTKNIQKTVKRKQIISEVYPSDKFVLQLKKIASEELGEPPPPVKGSFWEKVVNFLRKD